MYIKKETKANDVKKNGLNLWVVYLFVYFIFFVYFI